MDTPTDDSEYERHVTWALEQLGCTVEPAPEPREPYWDLAISTPDKRRGAVKLRWRKGGNLNHAQFNKLKLFLDSTEGERFDFGLNIVNTGFSKATSVVLEDGDPTGGENGKFVYAALVPMPGKELHWSVHVPGWAGGVVGRIETPPERRNLRKVAVYTDKGGVGKTSLAAHLAGAICYLGGDAVLVDVDPQQNLRGLLGEGVNIERGGKPHALVVEQYRDFHEHDYRDCYVVYDCSPSFSANPPAVFSSATDVVIPIVLSPLSILENAEVIDRSIAHIHGVNPEARIHIVVNQYVHGWAASRYNRRLLGYVRKHLTEKGLIGHPLVEFYDPAELCIRRSDHLLHWGMFLLAPETEPAQLAFDNARRGAASLLGDFLALADQIEQSFDRPAPVAVPQSGAA